MKKLICNYSIIRFLPYPETEEFVNVGVLACCPQVGWMDFHIDPRKKKRISAFFPELDISMFDRGRQRVIEDLRRITEEFKNAQSNQWVMKAYSDYASDVFAELTRAREEIFRFGTVATMVTANPKQDMDALYKHYVERHFAKQRDYQETIMTERLTDLFRQRNLTHRYHKKRLGTEDYHVTIPFVEMDQGGEHALRAVKPLNLAHKEATAIREHGDVWFARMRRLRNMELMPRHMMFAVNLPPQNESKRTDAAREICKQLRDENLLVANFDDKTEVAKFAERTDI